MEKLLNADTYWICVEVDGFVSWVNTHEESRPWRERGLPVPTERDRWGCLIAEPPGDEKLVIQ